jgi:SAM-dependent methyltransferase
MARTDTLERLIPASVASDDTTGQETFRLHVDRYHFAAEHALPGRAIDIACGVGYGTRILVDERPEIEAALGVDISDEAIAYAKGRYADLRTEYRVGDAMTFHSDQPFDTAVSLETIEHLPDPESFIGNLLRSIRPGGRLIASVPTTPSVDANPHHKHDFTERSFRRMFTSRGLRELACQRQLQPFNPIQVLTRKEKRLADLRPSLMRYYAAHPSAAIKRAWSTVVDGFNNRYITVVWEKP